MVQKKTFLIVLLLFTTFLLMANELENKSRPNLSAFSFNFQNSSLTHKISLGNNSNFTFNNNFQRYATVSRGTYIGMIVAGAVLMGTSFVFFLLPGIAVLAVYGYLLQELPREKDNWDRYLLPAGIAFTVIGGLAFAAGVALLVVGLVLKAKSDGKIATFIRSSKNNTQLGFVIKI